MTKKISVPIPEKKIAVLGLKPMIMGARTVAPNMASTCCRPRKMDCPQGSRSSGAMMPPALGVQPVKYLCIWGEGTEVRGNWTGGVTAFGSKAFSRRGDCIGEATYVVVSEEDRGEWVGAVGR